MLRKTVNSCSMADTLAQWLRPTLNNIFVYFFYSIFCFVFLITETVILSQSFYMISLSHGTYLCLSALSLWCHVASSTTSPGVIKQHLKRAKSKQRALNLLKQILKAECNPFLAEIQGMYKDGREKLQMFNAVRHKLKRFCRVCQNFKPTSTHHCSTCNRCVLRMDHHCVWINNCVGKRNLRLFLQMLIYLLLLDVLTIWLYVIYFLECLYFFNANEATFQAQALELRKTILVGQQDRWMMSLLEEFIVLLLSRQGLTCAMMCLSFIVQLSVLLFLCLLLNEQYERVMTATPGIDALQRPQDEGNEEPVYDSILDAIADHVLLDTRVGFYWFLPVEALGGAFLSLQQ